MKFGFKSKKLLNNGNQVKDLVAQSSKAVCGAFERELVVPVERLAETKARLKRAGFMIVGTDEPNGRRTRKIWFIRRGLAGL